MTNSTVTHISSSINLICTAIFVLVSLCAFNPAYANDKNEIDKVKQAVVKIYTTINAPDYFTPWTVLNSEQNSGSGSIITNQRILTNAHVVADASYIQVQRQNDPNKFRAQVEFIAHETDLAILTVEDPTFFESSTPLKIGKLPETQETVRTFGFPRGGNTLSVTKGVLSRVEHQQYAHSSGYFLAGQIDAAINPGNSGGPVIVAGKIVGVVMQANFSENTENQGYFVPPSVIQHVLTDIKDGEYDGFRPISINTQGMDSPALRARYKLAKNQTGVLVTRVSENSPAKDQVNAGDVILKINGFDISDDATITFRGDQRTHFKYALDQYHFDNPIEMRILRDGEEKNIKILELSQVKSNTLVREERFDEPPEYYIYGGVVFVPLSMNLIQRWGSGWHKKAPIRFLQQRYESSSKEREEAVVAIKVLPARVNLGFHDWSNWIIDSVNGEHIVNFSHLAKILNNNQNEHLIISDKDGYQMVIDHNLALETRDQVLQRYRIPSHYSQDLFEK